MSALISIVRGDNTKEMQPPSIPSASLSNVHNITSQNELKRWRCFFETHAHVMVNGEKFLDPEGFISAIASSSNLSSMGRAQFVALFRVADTSRRGLVSWDEFTVFQALLKRPDADYWIAFQYFDKDNAGAITFDQFKQVIVTSVSPSAIPFDLDCDWIRLHLGKRNETHLLGYNEFAQLLAGLQAERLRQAFIHFDLDHDGFIQPDQFEQITLDIVGHRLSNAVMERLATFCTLSPGGSISYPQAVAFYNVIRDMHVVERIIREAIANSPDGRIDQSDFIDHSADETSLYSHFTPMEVSVIFYLVGWERTYKRLALVDFAQLLDPQWNAPQDKGEKHSETNSFVQSFLHSAYSFLQGGIAGALGATIVYPIDMVKTRMQNQRNTVVGQMLYQNSLDCAQKIFRNEGFLGFYRGLGPQLIGVAPEKAIKLTMNGVVRGRALDPDTGHITLVWELVAGGSAGACQVIFTNPLEIVKIRLQIQGEAAKVEGAAPKGAIHIVRQLGIFGLYRGASACLLRDIPFSAIYFPAYAHLKKDIFLEGSNGKQLSFLETLGSAAIAGMPAAYLTTPADVVKTRLQVESRNGQVNYKGLTDAFIRIYREEGFRALFKGGPARVIRSSPQFGFTLLAYEYLHKFLPYPWRGSNQTSLMVPAEGDVSRIRARNALKILLDIHKDLGQS